MPFDSDLCVICYFYKTGMSSERFWQLHNSGYELAPYNIGQRVMSAPHPSSKRTVRLGSS